MSDDNRSRVAYVKKLRQAFDDLKNNIIDLENYRNIKGIPFKKVECVAENGIAFDSNIFNIFVNYIINGIVNEFAVNGPLAEHFEIEDDGIVDSNAQVFVYNFNKDNKKIIENIDFDSMNGMKFVQYIEDIIVYRYQISNRYGYYWSFDNEEGTLKAIVDEAMGVINLRHLRDLEYEMVKFTDKVDSQEYYDN